MFVPKKAVGNPSQTEKDSQKAPPLIRQGDWICVACSNLNFSFRSICNRCKIQTKETNFYNFVVSPPIQTMVALPLPDLPETELHSMFEQNKENKLFQSALLLTPTKNQCKVYEGEPYRSPCCLPSVSPLLKKYNDSILGKCSTRTKVSNTSSDIIVSKFKIAQFVFENSDRQDQDSEEMDDHISKLLSEIQIDI